MKKILVILGTRPEVIKLAPVIQALQQQPDYFQTKICDTGQHQELKQSVLDFFQIQPNYQLDGLSHSKTLSALTAYLLQELPKVLEDFQPDFVMVQGDTASAFAGSLAGFHAKIKIAHIEAGLRTHRKEAPFPEEIYRTLISHLADWHFAPTESAKQNLLREGIPEDSIHVVGNTVVDALQFTLAKLQQEEPASIRLVKGKLELLLQQYPKMILFTLHRRENLDHHLTEIEAALRAILQTQYCFMLFPVHLNPLVQAWATRLAQQLPNLILNAPLPYEAFVWAMQTCDLILTDSGGIQEEAPTLGKPVILLRAQTERPEAQEQGTVYHVSVERQNIISAVAKLLQQTPAAAFLNNPFGDGKAAARILEIIQQL